MNRVKDFMMKRNHNLLQLAFQVKPILFNFLFVLYLWLIQPMLMNLLSASKDMGGNIWLGWGLLFMPILELFGVFQKLSVANFIRTQTDDLGKTKDGVIVAYILGSVFHMGFSCLYMIVCFQIIQGTHLGNGSTFYSIFAVVVLFLVITKEAFFIVMILTASSLANANLPANNKFDRWLFALANQNQIRQLSLGDFFRDLAGDGYLFLFISISFTVMWEFIVFMNPPNFHSAHGMMDVLGVVLYFLLIYFSLRFSSFPFELNFAKKKIHWLLFLFSTFLATLVSIISLKA